MPAAVNFETILAAVVEAIAYTANYQDVIYTTDDIKEFAGKLLTTVKHGKGSSENPTLTFLATPDFRERLKVELQARHVKV